MPLPGGINSDKPTEYDGQSDMLRSAVAKGKKLHVGIVGAGFAGLRCADVLLQHGHQVTIFEARNRVGGRVGQSNHLGHLVDLGPNWIHGTDGNPIMKIAKQTRTRLHSWDETQQVYDVDGTPLSFDEAMEYALLLWDDGLIAEAFKYSHENTKTIPASKSLMDFFREKAEGLFTDLPPEQAKRKRKTLMDTAMMWGAYVGSPAEKQSLKFYWLEECIEGENPFVAETYHKILAHVAKPALELADIRYEHKVASVSCKKDASSQPSITTSDGKTWSFDEVVMTAPLGWLKRNKEAFKPGLKPRVSQAIDAIGYGSLDKVYITFPHAFWESDLTTPTSASNGVTLDKTNSTPNVTATTAPLHQAPSNSSTHYPGFTHWLSPSYAHSTNPEQWDQQGMNFAALPGNSAQPTILFYIYGPCAKHVASLIESQTPAEADQILYSFFQPYYSRLPNYDASHASCKPKAVLATAWANDEFAGYGSYSNFQVGLEDGDGDIAAMREGMPDEGVWFAGEHTAPLVGLGTSTGAWWSGEGVAKRILGKNAGEGGSDDGGVLDRVRSF
ncbi:hypothetical protein MBLNU459_g4150t2 [Dothideomycetes sp. NU459]